MTVEEIDEYLAKLEEPKRSTLEALRRTILGVLPDAEQGSSYGAPVFRVEGRPIAGFSAAKNHLSYLPHSGDVIGGLDEEDLAGFSASKGAVKMPIDTPLPDLLVRKLIAARCAEVGITL